MNKPMSIDWRTIYKRHKGKWVALLSDERTVVGSGKTARAALEAAKKQGHNQPTIMFVPRKVKAFGGQLYEIPVQEAVIGH